MYSNVITAVFGASHTARTKSLHQWDYGQVLQFAGVNLPDAYTVHFSNQGVGGEAKTMVGNADGVTIPDEYLTTGQAVYAWVYLHTGADDGETVYSVIIPVVARPQPTEDEPTPVQQGVIDQAIAALNAGVEAAQDAAESVQDMGVVAESLAAGSAATVDKSVDPDTGAVTLSFGIPRGDRGEQGPQGERGIQGEVGPAGPAGPQGAQGIQGERGPQGIQGETGPKGDTGATGATGPVGPQGERGETGATGPAGHTGPAGPAGEGVPAGGTIGQVLTKASGTDYDTVWTDLNPVVTVSGSTPSITALPGIRYICGEVSTLDITLPASGIVDIVFESGSTATVLTITGTVKWANGFDPTALDANTTYEINIADGLGVAGQWT